MSVEYLDLADSALHALATGFDNDDFPDLVGRCPCPAQAAATAALYCAPAWPKRTTPHGKGVDKPHRLGHRFVV